MRSEKLLKNSFVSVLAQFTIVLLQFVTRKVFVNYMNIELLGYESLFSNIFNLVSMAEMGIGNVIVFNLYREIERNNIENIKKYVNIYKILYRCVALIITVIGVICIPFLPYLINDSSAEHGGFIVQIYLLQLFGVVSGYLLSYIRTIFIADQKEYKCVICDLIGRIAIQIIQIIVLMLTSNFILYLITKIVINIFINLMVYALSKKDYPYLSERYYINIEVIKEANVFKDTKDFIIHKLANTIYGSTSNIVISSMLGIRETALFGNYYTVQNSVITMFLYKAINPLRASIGNLVYAEKSLEERRSLFDMFGFIGFFMANFVAISFLILYQPFIILWLGSDYLLSFSFVVVQVIIVYFQVNFEIIYMYRSAYGEFYRDKRYMVISAIVSLASSFIFVYHFGIIGALAGNLLGLLIIIFARVKFVFSKYVYLDLRAYIGTQVKFFLLFILESLITLIFTNALPTTLLGFIIKCAICVILPNGLNILFFRRTEQVRKLFSYIKLMRLKNFK